MALTQAVADCATSGGSGWTWIADDGEHGLGSGFGLRVYRTGARSYALRYRAAGRLRFYTIGRAHILTLEEARDRARQLLVRIGDGEDPAAERRRSRDIPASGIAAEPRTGQDTAGEMTPERLREEAEALLELAGQQARQQQETRFAAIDLLKRADELEARS